MGVEEPFGVSFRQKLVGISSGGTSTVGFSCLLLEAKEAGSAGK